MSEKSDKPTIRWSENMNRLKYIAAALIFPLLVASLMAGSSPARAQSNAESSDLAYFAALMQYIRSQPTPADVKSANIPVLSTLDTALSDIYITGFITPYTGETPEQVKARLQSVPEEDRFTAVMVESYRLASNPLLLNIIHELLPLYYVKHFTTAEDLNTSSEFLKRAEIATLAAAFDSTDYAIPAPSTTGAASPSAQRQDSVDSDYLAKFAAIMQYIRSQPTPADVKSANIPVLSTLDTALSDIYVTGFITPYTGETPEQVKARLQSVPEEKDRFTAVIVESYRLASNPLLLNIIHELLPLYYVEYFTTAEDLNASAEFLKRAEIATLADAFDPTDYYIPPPSADESADTGSVEMDRAALVALYNATDGANWSDSENWLSDMPVGEWRGVTADEDGRVTELRLRRNQLSGTIPPELGSLTNLTDLWLDNNRLNGAILPELGNLSSLIRLSLYSNELSGEIPPELGSLAGLERLFLNDNELSGKLPQEMTKLSALQRLTFYRNSTLCAPVDGAFQTWLLGIAQMRGSSCAPEDSPTDRAVLVGLHGDTDGANWADDTKWLSDRPLREWYGVTTDADGRVTGLLLDSNQLSGAIPSELGNLTNLTDLWLDSNQLDGGIPPELGNLTNLTDLILHNNELSGAIPPELGDLTNLRFLFLRSNELSGAIPPELGDLSSLIWLSLDSNELSGPIPPELGNLSTLKWLNLDGNQLSGTLPLDLTKLTNLQGFNFHNNLDLCAPTDEAFETWLQGIDNWEGNSCAVADDRAALVALYEATDGDNWSYNENWLSDQPMGEWDGVETGRDGRVTRLWLESNELNGEIPSELGRLTNLDQLVLWGNELSGEIPPELGDLTSLETLDLWNNDLSGEIPSELGSLTNLVDLSLGGNQLSGPIPPELGNLSTLKWLNLDGNQLSGTLPLDLTKLTNLQGFNFHNNLDLCAPTDEAFETWLQGIDNWEGNSCAVADDRAALVALYEATDGDNWSYNENWLSDQPMGEWDGVETGRDGRVTRLWLESNELNGEIPSELGRLTNLDQLVLWGNELSGEIPPELGDLTSLETLDLWGNELSGEIPPELGDLTSLEYLNLDENQLSGEIPSELGSLTNLVNLSLGGNDLSGEIPGELGDLSSLLSLGLNSNDLSGSVPPEIGKLTSLERLDLRYNRLSGVLPQELTHLSALERFTYNSNRNLCAPVDGTFQAWLLGIAVMEGSSCAPVDSSVDRAILIGLYEGTDGTNWDDDTNWVSDQPLRTWHGVTTDSGGRVTGIYLGGNRLSGEMPSSLGNLTRLTGLDFWANDLSGEIPSSLGDLSNLIRLGLGWNELTGEIPSELGRLTSLQWLYLDNNQLNGEIPPELGNLSSLTELWLRENELSGEIPPELGSLNGLRRLHLSDNNLSGDIPSELGNLTDLWSLYLAGNQLAGCVPEALMDVDNNDFDDLSLPFCS